MVLLKEEQVKEKLRVAIEKVGRELEEHKGSYSVTGRKNSLTDDFSLKMFKPNTVGQQFSVEEIKKKLNSSFLDIGLKNVEFEFGIATFGRNGVENYFDRKSEKFATFYSDTLHHIQFMVPLIPPSGSAGENLSMDEVFIVMLPSIDTYVLQSIVRKNVIRMFFIIFIYF